MPELNDRSRGVVIAAWLVAACGGDEVTSLATSEPGTSTTVDTSAGPSTGAPTSGEPTTSGGMSMSATATMTATATATATVPTTDPDTTADTGTGEPPLTTGPQTSDTGETGETGSSSEGGSSGDTGAEFIPCQTAADCLLIDDCCQCEPIGPGETPEKCDLPECFVTQCGPAGLEGAALACRFGRCTFEKVECNPANVICKSLPPDCGPLDVPSVDIVAGCWTGQCVPAEACNWVPDCTYCAEDELICVQKLQKGAFEVCEPKPVDCGDADDIDCGCGQQVCDASPPHTICHDAVDDIACECDNC